MEDKNNKQDQPEIIQIANTAIPNCCGSCEYWELNYDVIFCMCPNISSPTVVFNYCENYQRLSKYKLTHDEITTELINAAQSNNPQPQLNQNGIHNFINSPGNLPIYETYVNDVKVYIPVQAGMIAIEVEINIAFDIVDDIPELVSVYIQDADDKITELSTMESAEVYANNKVIIDDAMIDYIKMNRSQINWRINYG